MPGYMLVQMELTDDTWHLVQNIPKVTRFLGTGPKPQAVPDSQVEEVLRQLEDKAKHVVNANMYNMGDKVTVTDGPFDTFSGVVEEVDSEKSRLKVSISIFGRATPIDLNFSQVKQES
jgi:transcriptional antiterminator NusG